MASLRGIELCTVSHSASPCAMQNARRTNFKTTACSVASPGQHPYSGQRPSSLTHLLHSQKLERMKTERLPKILLIAFVFALVIYLPTFGLMQSCRTSKGPWHVQFSTDTAGTPALLIEHPRLNVSQKLIFPDQKISQTNLAQPFVFDDPTKTNAPFGDIVFEDLTFLPGTVTFNFFGHEVELLPRVLIIDKQEHPWKSGEAISVTGVGKYKPRKRK